MIATVLIMATFLAVVFWIEYNRLVKDMQHDKFDTWSESRGVFLSAGNNLSQVLDKFLLEKSTLPISQIRKMIRALMHMFFIYPDPAVEVPDKSRNMKAVIG